MTPRCIEGRERQIRDSLKKGVGEWLSKNGYKVLDKDLSFFPMIGYIPDFHLRYRCFLNKLVGYTPPNGKAHSFIIPLDGTPVVESIIKGMVTIPKPCRTDCWSKW